MTGKQQFCNNGNKYSTTNLWPKSGMVEKRFNQIADKKKTEIEGNGKEEFYEQLDEIFFCKTMVVTSCYSFIF